MVVLPQVTGAEAVIVTRCVTVTRTREVTVAAAELRTAAVNCRPCRTERLEVTRACAKVRPEVVEVVMTGASAEVTEVVTAPTTHPAAEAEAPQAVSPVAERARERTTARGNRGKPDARGAARCWGVRMHAVSAAQVRV